MALILQVGIATALLVTIAVAKKPVILERGKQRAQNEKLARESKHLNQCLCGR
jgi:hypothetical protein